MRVAINMVEAPRTHNPVVPVGAVSARTAENVGAGLSGGLGFVVGAGATAALATNPVGWAVMGFTAALAPITGLIARNQLNNDRKEAATATTRYVEELLKGNIARWKALKPEQKTRSMQAQYLQFFEDARLWFMGPEGCGNPSWGKPGRNCVEERVFPGAKYTWYPSYYDPIANDPEVREDPVSGQAQGQQWQGQSQLSTALGLGPVAGIPPELLVGGALILAGFMLSSGGNSGRKG